MRPGKSLVSAGSGACAMIEETGKRRRSRIELGYYRAPDRLSRWRGRLCLIAMLAAAAWLATSAIASRSVTSHAWLLEPSRLASKGPLAQAHADLGFDLRCMPRRVRSDQWLALGARTLGGFARGKQEVHGLPCRAGPSSERASG